MRLPIEREPQDAIVLAVGNPQRRAEHEQSAGAVETLHRRRGVVAASGHVGLDDDLNAARWIVRSTAAARTNTPWGGGGRDGMTRLAQMFPTLREADGVAPWEPEALMRWAVSSGALTSGSAHAVAFLLNVWNSRVDWREVAAEVGLTDTGELFAFNCAEAIACWDEAHAAAFLAWCRDPFHP